MNVKFSRVIGSVSACIALVLLSATPVRAAPTVFRPFTHNIEHNQLGAILAITSGERPLTVAVQEVCSDEYHLTSSPSSAHR